MNKELLFKTFRNTTGAAIYIFLVSQIMQNGEKLFGQTSDIIGPFAILLLFTLSAAVVSSLTFGLSVILFFENKKNDSIKAAIYSVSWLGLYTILGLGSLVIAKYIS